MEIIYEDNHLIAVNKPFGMPSQGDVTGDETVFDYVKEYIRVKYNKPGNVYTALLHRLDRPAGGILLLAKTSKAATRVSEMFKKRQIQKTYFAITEKIPEHKTGVLIHHLKQLPDKNIMRAYQKPVQGSKEAELSYRVIRTAGKQALLEIKLKTGRKHQIRVQLAAIGCTIKGDVKYGITDFNPDKSIALLAGELSLTHPVTKAELTLKIPLPDNSVWQKFI